jgi:hypothetical protein
MGLEYPPDQRASQENDLSIAPEATMDFKKSINLKDSFNVLDIPITYAITP